MIGQDAGRLSRKTPPTVKDNLFLTYEVYLFLPLLLILIVLLVIRGFLPSFLSALTSWLAALSTGILLVAHILMFLVRTSLKIRSKDMPKLYTGMILGGLTWLIGASLVAILLLSPGSRLSASLAILLIPVISLAALPIFSLTLYIIAGFLLPAPGENGLRRKAYRHITDYIKRHNFPVYVVTDERFEEDKIVQRVKGNSFSDFARGPGFVIVDCDHAVAITDGISLKGVQGPGVVEIGFADDLLRTLDLRPQLRNCWVQGLTKDGIPVKVLVFAPFQVNRGNGQPDLGRPFSYRKKDAIAAVKAQKIEHPGTSEEPVQLSWDNLATGVAERIMQDILSQYDFDDLYAPFDTQEDEPPRVKIAGEFLEKLGEELKTMGIQLIGGGISNLLPADDKVLEERLHSWQADWERQVLLRQAESHAQWVQCIEQARADAKADLILTMGKKLAKLNQRGIEVSPDMIIDQFLTVLEQMAMQPALQQHLPRSLLKGMRQLWQSTDLM